MEKAKRRTPTSPGLGVSGLRPKQETPSVPPPTSGLHDQQSSDARDVRDERAEEISTRRPRTSRPPVRVDDVGDVAVAIAVKLGRESRSVPPPAPKLLKTRAELSSAPINHRDAFVLSLIDGRTSTQGVIDLAAMPDGEVLTILARLAELGIVSLP